MSVTHSGGPFRDVAAFVALAAVVSWSVWLGGALLAPESMLAFVLAGAWGPTVAALVLTARSRGLAGVRRLLGELGRWRTRPRWYGVAVLGVPAVVGLAAGVHLLLGGRVPAPTFPVDLSGNREYLLLPVVFLVNVAVGGPLAEELGWRGHLQPLLTAVAGVVPGGLVVGLVWSLWHLPLFLVPGGDMVVGGLPFAWFLPLLTGWSAVFAWVVARGGSLLLAVLLHASMNTTLGTLGLLRGPPRLRALVLLVTALVVVALAVVDDSTPGAGDGTGRGR